MSVPIRRIRHTTERAPGNDGAKQGARAVLSPGTGVPVPAEEPGHVSRSTLVIAGSGGPPGSGEAVPAAPVPAPLLPVHEPAPTVFSGHGAVRYRGEFAADIPLRPAGRSVAPGCAVPMTAVPQGGLR